MGHIFISYSHKDTAYAHGLANNLQSMGFDVWIDERLDYGSQWPLEIQKQLDTCDAFILIMTPNSLASDWVQSELQRAKRKLKPIFPLLLKDEPWLSVESTQYYDVRGENFPDAKFFSALKRVVTTSPSSSTMEFSKTASQPKPVAANSSPSKFTPTMGFLSVGILAFVFVACAGVVVGLRFLLPGFQAPNSVPTATTELRQNIEPTQSLEPTNVVPPSDTPILPSATFTSVPPTLTSTDVPPTATFTPIPPTWTPEPIIVSRDYPISICCNSAGQRSSTIDYVLTVNTVGVLKVEFVPQMQGSCADVFLHILWDDNEIYQTESVGPVTGRTTTGLIDLSSAISKGKHTLTISPEGWVGGGGCNTGTLGGWAGTLTVETSRFP